MEKESGIRWLTNAKYKPYLSKGRLNITIFICLVIVSGLVFGQIVLGSLVQYWEYTLVIIIGSIGVYVFGIFWIEYFFGSIIPQKIGVSPESLYICYRNKPNAIRWEDLLGIEEFPKDKKVKNPAYYVKTKNGKNYRLGRIGTSIEEKLIEEIIHYHNGYKSRS